MIKTTQESLEIVKKISENMEGHTFHHHYHILYDIGEKYGDQNINYVEIGCFAGASACLMLQRPNTQVISIDLGHPISPDLARRNVEKFNKLGNPFVYLQGNSQSQEMADNLMSFISHIDILFIDGDHSYSSVIKDFTLYNSLVKPGGYIIFDDYNDTDFSPEVKPAVDDITKKISKEFEIIGVIPNFHKARPSEMEKGNEFVIRKL